MKWKALPEVIDLEGKLQAANYKRAEAIILFDHAVDVHDHVIAKIAREALQKAGEEIEAIQFLLHRLKGTSKNLD
jgi:hypothetical protein